MVDPKGCNMLMISETVVGFEILKFETGILNNVQWRSPELSLWGVQLVALKEILFICPIKETPVLSSKKPLWVGGANIPSCPFPFTTLLTTLVITY